MIRRSIFKLRGYHNALAREELATMPPLTHGSDPYDIMKSDVAAWLTKQPGVLQVLFNAVRNSGLIKFDPDSKTWQANPDTKRIDGTAYSGIRKER